MGHPFKTVPIAAVVLCAVFAQPIVGQTNGGIRDVEASERSLIPLQTRLRYTTMIVLPEGEEILDVLCGDRDFWVVSATQNIAHVKPAKANAETNLNLVTTGGAIYSFLLIEKNGGGTPDLKVYVNGSPETNGGKRKYYSSGHVEELEAQLVAARGSLEGAARRASEEIATFRQQYPTRLQFAYGTPKYEKPFLVRSMWHDGQFTYVKSDATELPALYEMQDGKPSVVNFQVQNGTYVVPKVLERGYLALGNERFSFTQQGR
jgi:type IV secretory pathway VirB9-like protein